MIPALLAVAFVAAVLLIDLMGVVITVPEIQAAILATQKQIANTMSPMRKRDLQRHLARLRRKLRAAERIEMNCGGRKR